VPACSDVRATGANRWERVAADGRLGTLTPLLSGRSFLRRAFTAARRPAGARTRYASQSSEARALSSRVPSTWPDRRSGLRGSSQEIRLLWSDRPDVTGVSDDNPSTKSVHIMGCTGRSICLRRLRGLIVELGSVEGHRRRVSGHHAPKCPTRGAKAPAWEGFEVGPVGIENLPRPAYVHGFDKAQGPSPRPRWRNTKFGPPQRRPCLFSPANKIMVAGPVDPLPPLRTRQPADVRREHFLRQARGTTKTANRESVLPRPKPTQAGVWLPILRSKLTSKASVGNIRRRNRVC